MSGLAVADGDPRAAVGAGVDPGTDPGAEPASEPEPEPAGDPGSTVFEVRVNGVKRNPLLYLE